VLIGDVLGVVGSHDMLRGLGYTFLGKGFNLYEVHCNFAWTVGKMVTDN